MYTFVMMAALTSAPEAPQFNGFFRDLAGGSGCHADGRSESDSKNCNGCCGGGVFHGRIMSFFNSFLGERGSCCGGSCRGSSCSGSCSGRSAASTCHGSSCSGSRRDSGSSCHGSASCFGSSCMGSSTFAPMSIPYPGDYAQPIPSNSGYGSGCFAGSFPSYPGGAPTIVPGGGYDTVPFSPPTSVPSERDTYRPTVIDDGARGVIIVRLPEDAKLFAEGRQLSLKTDVRRFVTPPLPANRDAIYNLRVEYTREGEVISRTKKVAIRAGETKELEFAEQTAKSPPVNLPELFAEKPGLGTPMIPVIPTVTLPMGTPTGSKPQVLPPLGSGTVIPPPQPLSDRAKITVKLTPGAVLFVDKRRNDRTETVREFTTAALKKGDLYTYTLRAEWSREGQLEFEERKVEFMAGELHTVDFTLPMQRASR